MRGFLLFPLCLAGLVSALPALEVGDKFPDLPRLRWFVEEVADPASAAQEQVSLVVFWDSTSPECRTAIPLLNRLYRRHRQAGLVVMAITREQPDSLAMFLVEEQAAFPIAFDAAGEAHQACSKNLGVPFAFLVGRDKRVLWSGHPLRDLERSVSRVMAGTWDPEKQAQADRLEAQIQRAAQENRQDEVFDLLAKLIELQPDLYRYYQFQATLLGITGQSEKIPAVLAAWERGCRDSAEGLGVLADVLIQHDDASLRDPLAALRCANAAMALSGGDDPRAYVSMARIYAALGFFDRAIRVLQQGEKALPMPGEREELQGIRVWYEKLLAARRAIEQRPAEKR